MAVPNDSFDVSVVIPLYNHARYIGPALDSVLAQTLPAREIILIDDGSSDDGVEIARRKLEGHPAATVLIQPNAGAHNTINRCIGLARSRHIAVLNSDDLFEPGKLERCAELWRQDPALDLVFGDVALIDDDGCSVHTGPTVEWLERARDFLLRSDRLDLALANENFAVTTSNFVFSRKLWERNGGFAALRYCHDLDFVFAAIREGRVLYDADFAHIRYRVHAANTIKEYVNRVRVEIAGVLACALDGGLLGDPTEMCDERTVALFGEALADKGLGSLVLFLSARLAAFGGNRAAFYDWAIADPTVNGLLLRQLEGSLSGLDFDSQKPRALYRAGGSAGGKVAKARAVLVSDESANDLARERFESFRRLLESTGEGRSAPTSVAVKAAAASLDGPVVVELAAFDRGGLEKVVLDTCVVLRDYGLDSVIVSCGIVGHLGALAREQGFTVYELSSSDPRGHYRRILKEHGIRLAVSHFSRTGYPLFRELGIPNVTFIHNVYAFLAGDALENFRRDDAFVDRYISVSPKATDYAVDCLGVDRAKIVTSPNGLLVQEHVARAKAAAPVTRAQFGIAEDDFLFLNVASYNLHKSHYLMAEAISMVLRKTDRVRILCIGNTIVPAHVENLRAHLEAIGVADHMLMPGHFPEVAPFHAIADAFLLPSFIEGWSIAMNEAMFFGKPMILSDTGGSSEVIRGDDIGILLPNEYGAVGNLDSAMLDAMAYDRRTYRTSAFLARAMLDMASNAGHWRKAGLAGHRRVVDEYDFIDVVRSYLPVFQDVIAGAGR